MIRNDLYPAYWPALAEEVKRMAGWNCENCGASNNRVLGRVLTVHHLDGIKINCCYKNLVALCQRCHLRLQRRFNPASEKLQQTFLPKPGWMLARGL